MSDVSMDRTERFYLIERLLKHRRSVNTTQLLQALDVSRATLMRDIAYMRDRMRTPIVFDADMGGYRLDPAAGERSELPGMWFNASEAQALLAMLQLLRDIEPGVLAAHVAPLQQRLQALIGEGGYDAAAVLERVRLVPLGKRRAASQFFETVASALLSRKRLRVEHHNRHTDERHVRELSPLRLTYYRDNWYLDAWCHLREDLRSFSVDAMSSAQVLDAPAHDVDDEDIRTRFDSGYGIFSHPTAHRQWAQLKFSAYRARWAATEQWHPEQRITWLDGGELLLEVPYHDERELVGDVLRQGAECEVVGPEGLRRIVRDELSSILRRYGLPAHDRSGPRAARTSAGGPMS